jgi:hypothetical protein
MVAAGVFCTAAATGQSGAQTAHRGALLFASGRDGKKTVYAAEPVRGRVSVLTRVAIDEFTASKNGNWLAFAPKDKGTLFLASGDGRNSRRLGKGESGIFSPNGRQFVFARSAPQINADAYRIFVVSLRGGPPHPYGEGYPRAFSPEGRLLAFHSGDAGRLGLLDLRTRRRRIVPGTAGSEVLGWSPGGRRILLRVRDPERLLVVDTFTRRPSVVSVMKGEEDDRLDAAWTGPQTVGYLWHRDSESDELGTISATGGGRRVLSTGTIYWVEWSWGGHVAFSRSVDGRTELVVQSGGQEHVLGPGGTFGWSPSGRLLAVDRELDSGAREFTLFRPDGSITRWFSYRGSGPEDLHTAWSPDGRRVVVGLTGGFGVVSIATGKVRRLWTGSWNRDPYWTVGALPTKAPAAPSPPKPELARGTTLRSRGLIKELAADALSGQSAVDCDHVLAWTQGTRGIVRFEYPEPCDRSFTWDFDVDIAGSEITWKQYYCGNYCYVGDCQADVRAAYRDQCSEGGTEVSRRPPRPAPREETRGNVSITTLNGTITLRQLSGGATRVIRPPRGAVDAELEDDGVFYAYNLKRGSMRGRIVFLPRASFFTE